MPAPHLEQPSQLPCCRASRTLLFLRLQASDALPSPALRSLGSPLHLSRVCSLAERSRRSLIPV